MPASFSEQALPLQLAGKSASPHQVPPRMMRSGKSRSPMTILPPVVVNPRGRGFHQRVHQPVYLRRMSSHLPRLYGKTCLRLSIYFLNQLRVRDRGFKSPFFKGDLGSGVRLGNCMRRFHPPHPSPLPPKRGERE